MKEGNPIELPLWYGKQYLSGDDGVGDESNWVTMSDLDRLLNPPQTELPPEELAPSPILVGIAEPI